MIAIDSSEIKTKDQLRDVFNNDCALRINDLIFLSVNSMFNIYTIMLHYYYNIGVRSKELDELTRLYTDMLDLIEEKYG